MNLSAVSLDYPFDDSESKARSSRVPPSGLIGTVEALKYLFAMLGGDAGPAILD